MGVRVKPIGYLNVAPSGGFFRPIIDLNTVVAIGTSIVGWAAIKLVRRLPTFL